VTTTTPAFRWKGLDAIDEAVAVVDDLAPDQLKQIMDLPELKIITDAFKTDSGLVDGMAMKTLHCTASSTIKDLHGDFMTEECVKDMARQAKQSLTIFLNHKYDAPEDVGGRVYAADARPTGEHDSEGKEIWDLHYDIALTRNNSRVEQIYKMVRDDGIRLGISIGAYIVEYDYIDKEAGFWGGLIINKVLLVETSVVGIPANQRSWVQNGVIAIGKSLGIAEKQIRRVFDGKEAAPMTLKTASLNDNSMITTTTADNVILNETATTTTELVIEQADDTETTSTEEVQEATEAAPETESPAEETTEETTEEPVVETTEASAPALEVVAPEIALSLNEGNTPTVELVLAALEQAAETLTAVRTEKATLQVKYDALLEERDQAIKDRDDAAEIIAIVARSPLGRKSQFVAPVQTFRSRFGDIYDEAFLKLLESE